MIALQRYISDELTHFVGRRLDKQASQYELLVKILQEGWLTFPPHDQKIIGYTGHSGHPSSIINGELYNTYCICFCDIPVQDLQLHASKYSRFGLSFPKEMLRDWGATPIFYVVADGLAFPPDSETLEQLGCKWHEVTRKQHFESVLRLFERFRDFAYEAHTKGSKYHGQNFGPFNSREVLRLVKFLEDHIFCFMKFFDQQLSERDRANFYFEREWRLRQNLKFELDHVTRVLIPREYRKKLREEVPQYAGQITFI